MEKRNIVKNQKGFTLIEIIAVLVILGILAAVAVPKYMSMAAEAEKKAVIGAVAELNARITLDFAKKMLNPDYVSDVAFDENALGESFVLTGLGTTLAPTAGSIKVVSSGGTHDLKVTEESTDGESPAYFQYDKISAE